MANALVADITPEDKRDERFGKMGVSSNLGYVIGPAMAGVLSGTILGYELPIIFAMGISIFAVTLIIFTLTDPKSSAPCVDPHAANAHKVMGQEHCPSIQAKSPTPLSIANLLRLPGIRVFMATYFLVMLAFNFFYVAFPVQAATEMQWTVKHTGAFFSVMSIFMVVFQGAILPRLSKIWSDKSLVCAGGVVLGLGFLALSPANDWIAFMAAILIALGNGLMWPPIVALLSKAAGDYQGAVLGLAGSVSAAASILGLFLGGLMYPHFGDWLFVLSAGLIFAVVMMTPWFPRGKPEKFN